MKKHTSNMNKFRDQMSSFITTLWASANWKFMQLVDLQWMYKQAINHEIAM